MVILNLLKRTLTWILLSWSYASRIKMSFDILKNDVSVVKSFRFAVPEYDFTVEDKDVHRSRENVRIHKAVTIMAERYGWMTLPGDPKRQYVFKTGNLRLNYKSNYQTTRLCNLTPLGAELVENLPSIWRFSCSIFRNDVIEFIDWFYQRTRYVVLLFLTWLITKYWDFLLGKVWELYVGSGVKGVIDFLICRC